MILLTLSNISKSFVMNRVLTDVSLTLPQYARMGIVGVNGCGKSTMFQIITGRLQPDEGTVSLMKGTTVGFLTQHADIESDLTVTEELSRVFDDVKRMEARLRELEAEMAEKHADEQEMKRLSDAYARLTARFEDAGGYEWPSRIQGVLAGLGFSEERRQQKASLLSGGEKTRLCLARLLLRQPDLLLLDEPTNHLDLPSIGWLEDTLKKYKGTVMVISHDRYFLNAVCDHMAELRQTHLTQYTGNYDQFAVKREADLERQLKEYNMQQAEIERQEAIIRRYRMYNREKSIKLAESREKRLEKMERLEKPVDDQRVRFRFEARRRSGDDVLIAKDVSKSFGSRTLFRNFSIHLRAGDRVALIGPNGVGKSTLLRLIVKEQKADDGTIRYGANVDIGYYDQQQTGLHADKTVLDELWDRFPQMEQSELRSVLGCFLFTGDDVFQPIRTLSGGEKGRVALTRLMLEKDNFLLLDEPTNHLDMDSREVLEGALDDFPGTILAVSHDRYFINRIATRIIEMRPDGVKFYLGNYDDYLEKKRREAEGVEERAPGVTRTALEKEKKRDRQAREADRQEKARIAAVEKEIADLEAKIADLEARSALPEVYASPEKAKENALALRQAHEALDEKYDLWAELSE